MCGFLDEHAETSLFLSSNLAAHGPALSDHPSSGNFRCVRSGTEILGVFCLTKQGNLLVELAGQPSWAGAVLEACDRDGLAIRRVLGEWRVASTLWQQLLLGGRIVETFAWREILFRLPLDEPAVARAAGARRLAASDFAAWSPLNLAYAEELGLSGQSSEEQRRAAFAESASAGHVWGHFVDGQLVAIAGLSARHGGIGQVGGVFTPAALRRRGYSRSVMLALISDSRTSLGLSKLILFTGRQDPAPQGLYRSLGFDDVGEFGVMFGEPTAQLPSVG